MWAAAVAVQGLVLAGARAAGAQAVPDSSPSSTGMPGVELINQVLDWGHWAALAAALMAVLVGAGLWGWGQMSGNYAGAGRGRSFVAGGLLGAAVAGLGPELVKMVHEAAFR